MIEFSVDLRVNFKSTDLLFPVADGAPFFFLLGGGGGMVGD